MNKKTGAAVVAQGFGTVTLPVAVSPSPVLLTASMGEPKVEVTELIEDTGRYV